MKNIFLSIASLLLVSASPVLIAQGAPHSEIAMGYTFLRSNAPAGQCGCFHWQGGTLSGAVGLKANWSIAGAFTGVHAGHENDTTLAPTMVTYLVGPRYNFANDRHRVIPFADLMVGGAYGSAGYFVTGSSAPSVAMKIGGGVTLSLSEHWALRPIEADYLWTHFDNGKNSRQNSLQLSTAIVYRFGRR